MTILSLSLLLFIIITIIIAIIIIIIIIIILSRTVYRGTRNYRFENKIYIFCNSLTCDWF